MEFEYEEKEGVDKRRILWVLVWVLLFTALIVVGSWLFRSSKRPEVEAVCRRQSCVHPKIC